MERKLLTRHNRENLFTVEVLHKQIAEKAPDDDPAELIRETLAIELEIADGLEKLLKEIEAR
ncbi:MAG: hypothetical protein JRJ29_06990 [Deltaproteobacteria bacterium]|nr:hypothetical protein [Deltaproteobacteria bacterium]